MNNRLIYRNHYLITTAPRRMHNYCYTGTTMANVVDSLVQKETPGLTSTNDGSGSSM